MGEYSLTEQFALIALDGQSSKRFTASKKVAMRGVAMAGVLEKALAEVARDQVSMYLKKNIQEIRKKKKKDYLLLEQEVVRRLLEQNALSKEPDLLGCDINYQTAGVSMWEYKCREEVYIRITEGVRAEILEPGEVCAETVCLLYLFRECGCMHDLFSIKEQEHVAQRFVELRVQDVLYRAILETEFHSGIQNACAAFVWQKHKLFRNPYLQGVALAFPFFDRRSAIFIDTIVLGADVSDRRAAVMRFLREKGHSCEEALLDGGYLIKIDNRYYKACPYAKSYRVPVQGVELRPVYR